MMPMASYRLLHTENLARIPLVGHSFIKNVERRMEETVAALPSKDPGISVVIRSRNNCEQLAGLLDDIDAQVYNGPVEVIVVDTESRDGSTDLARSRGAKVLNIKQADFSYPKSLNLGFAAAKHEWILSLVEHSALAHTATFKVASQWNSQKNVAGIYGVNLPNGNATRSERLTYGAAQLRIIARSAHITTKRNVRGGFMAANNSLTRRKVWKELGGFNEAYGAGGEDFAFGTTLLKSGYDVARDPALSLYHTHGLHSFQQIQQVRYWYSLSNPLSFDSKKLYRYRSDLRENNKIQD
jgi:glycosyltransferase involved in cell wall biosynthesis